MGARRHLGVLCCSLSPCGAKRPAEDRANDHVLRERVLSVVEASLGDPRCTR
jgi:hypothetical protein